MSVFFVDDGSFCSLSRPNVDILMGSFCDLIAELHDRSFETLKWSGIYSAPIFDQWCLTELMYNAQSPLSKGVRQRLSQAIDRSVFWDAENEAPPIACTLNIAGNLINDITLTRSFELAATNTPSSCVAVGDGYRPIGWSNVFRPVDGATADIHFCLNASQLAEYFRRSIILSNATAAKFFELRQHAFPNLIFHPNVAGQFGDFSRNYISIREDLVRVLGALNDHFVDIYKAENGIPSEVSTRMSARCGFDFSPESSQTHRNNWAMNKRNVQFEGETYLCEWHAKLLPHIDRIHFCPAFRENKILIGIFTDHLPT